MSTNLRPLALGEMLDRGFQLYRSRFLLFMGISAVAYLPVFVIQTGILWVPKLVAHPAGLVVVFAGYILLAIFSTLAVAAASAATVFAVSAAYLDRSITLREAYGRTSGMWWRVFFLIIVMGIGIAIGTVLLIVPGIIVACMWALAIPVTVLEDADIGDSLARSRVLTEGHRFRVLAIYLLYIALLGALESAFAVPLIFLIALKGVAAQSAPAIVVGYAAVTYAIRCVVTPVLTISLSLMYYDERVRKEAFDIQLMMAALGEAPAEGPALSAS